jgi:glutamate synthase (ferredoxin)
MAISRRCSRGGMLYRPEFEHDACGVGFIADMNGRRSHTVVEHALTALGNLVHRGAMDADSRTGDGAGIMTQLPLDLLRPTISATGTNAVDDDIAVGMLFIPRHNRRAGATSREIVEAALREYGVPLLGWRLVPVNSTVLGDKAALTEPEVYQVIVGRPDTANDDEFERRLYLVRRTAEMRASEQGIDEFYVPSFSANTIVYKGLFVGPQIGRYYLDLQDDSYVSALAVFHQRYSTNTFPNWALAQPFRRVAHNGEINTLRGNENWMTARGEMDSTIWNGRLSGLGSPLDPSGSDSSKFDSALELYQLSGRCLPHSIMMMVPEAFERSPEMDEEVRGFHRFHSCLTEPWDGPAALIFSDGVSVGAALDRNGLRPARYTVMDDGMVYMGSEVGFVHLDDAHVVEKGRLGPGQMISINTRTNCLTLDHDIKHEVAMLGPWREWADAGLRPFDHRDDATPSSAGEDMFRRQLSFGYAKETIEIVLKPMIVSGKEPMGSMGDDTPLAVLSQHRRWLYSWFRQLFAQVTNPPIDHLRETMVMSLTTLIGARGNPLAESPNDARLVTLDTPVLTPSELDRLAVDHADYLQRIDIEAVFIPGESALRKAVSDLARKAASAVKDGNTLLVLTHRTTNPNAIAIPMPMAVGAVHQHLAETGWRMATSIVADTDDALEVHHMGVLIGNGADVVVPRLAFETVVDLVSEEQIEGITLENAIHAYRHTLSEGLLKIISRMGISTIASYRGAQIFEILGLAPEIVDECFAGTVSRIGGIGWDHVERDVVEVYSRGRGDLPARFTENGTYRYRKGLEYHALNPIVFKALHQAVRNPGEDRFRQYADLVESRPPSAIRDLLEPVAAGLTIPIDEVESAEEIVKRFVTPAMSLGSLSPEAHETLAIAMNRLGAKSNSGEGGENPERFERRPDGDTANSKIKQVASARFGVTPEYLAAAREVEIKMAQGAKPGEGGQLPGHKVTPEIARVRHSVPGVTLISPPPHHDIYSIEDLAQLIHDLKTVNSRAKVAVKLVSEAGIGTVAAGVAKAFADVIHISGHDGGTGASPLSSIKNVGLPWELGLAEAQQTLMLNGLRGRVLLRVDGGMKTGRDVIIAAMLGAEEYGFGTASLVASGCVMARQCHLNTCPVGVASQNPDLRKKFPGKPEHIIEFMMGVATQVRETLASLGVRSMDEIIGRVDMLRPRDLPNEYDLTNVDLKAVLAIPDETWRVPRRHRWHRNDRVEESLDDLMLQDARDEVRGRGRTVLEYRVTNSHRAVGAGLAGEIAYEHGDAGLDDGAIECRFTGSAGQSFGAFCVGGLRLILTGEANDYVGKGMHGGEIIIRPSQKAAFNPGENVILGNTVLYGATGGVLLACGRAGERFAVRNSGGTAVVEGVGDHGCEYMTGGTVVVLGPTGRNFAAGMTGGTAYVYDENDSFSRKFNPQLVELFRVTDTVESDTLRTLIERHVLETGSANGARILDDWSSALKHFWKVAPHETSIPEVPSVTTSRRRDLPVVEMVEGEHVEAHVGEPVHPAKT